MSKLIQISIIGCPNVGKSTIINRICNKQVSIVSPIPQTTRRSMYTQIDYQDNKWIIWDTPGVLEPKNKLDLFLNSEAINRLKQSDVIVYIVDGTTTVINEQTQKIYELLQAQNETPVILIYSKADMIKNQTKFETLQTQIETNVKFIKKYILNLNTDDLHEVLDTINNQQGSDEAFFEPISTVEQDDFFITEIVREQIIKQTFYEVPHSATVILESKKYDQERNTFHIHCSIVVEKESQKGIIIGKGGAKIKEIGIGARKSLEEIYDSKINLRLFCKVEKDWRDNNFMIKSLGFKKWH